MQLPARLPTTTLNPHAAVWVSRPLSATLQDRENDSFFTPNQSSDTLEASRSSRLPVVVPGSEGSTLTGSATTAVASASYHLPGYVLQTPALLLKNSGNTVQIVPAQEFPSEHSLFSHNPAVTRFLSHLVQHRLFSVSNIKRAMHSYMLDTNMAVPVDVELGMFKPHCLNVRDLFHANPTLFRCGSTPVPSLLKLDRFDHYHVQSCVDCRPTGKVSPTCYFATLRMCISHGWNPIIDVPSIKPVYAVSGNYPSVERFSVSTEKEFAKMLLWGVAAPAPPDLRGIVCPMGAVIKSSDRVRARILADVIITDSASLALANEILLLKGYSAIKARITVDATAPGINAAAFTPPFSYSGPQDALRIITPGCWLAKSDVSRYFWMFPLAEETRPIFMVDWKGVAHVLPTCMFGFSACPYYCSAWSAEFRQWVLSYDIACCHMVDDWLTAHLSKVGVERNKDRIRLILEDAGFSMATEKDEIGQSIVFLGILIDTVRMVLSFDSTQCKGMVAELVLYKQLAAVWSVNKGRCKEELGLETLARILGLCDEYHVQILALWVPRELNKTADYLSHLANSLNRSEVRGILPAKSRSEAGGEAGWS